MAVVYEAVDTRLDRVVALKVMHPWLANDADLVARFAREAKSAARLSNPTVVHVHDQGRDGERVWLAMEYVEGRTLRDVLRERGRLQPAEVLQVALPILEALSAAHDAGLVHRDVKPENVLIADDGRIKVADFGLVRAVSAATSTRTDGAVLGSVSYLAPELLERGIADERVDVYATGILLFELLTGSKPFEGETPIQVAYQHVHDDVPAPSSRVRGIPSALDLLVVRATRRDPDARPRLAGEMLAEARLAQRALGPADEPTQLVDPARTLPAPGTQEQRPRPPRPRTPAEHTALQPRIPRRRHVRRRRALLALVVVLCLLGGGGYATWGPPRYASTPQLAGLTAQQAQALAAKDGFQVEPTDSFHDSVPRGEVISASPREGHWTRKGSTLRVLVSLGREMHDIPAVLGKTPHEAGDLIARARLKLGSSSTEWSDTVAKGRVVATQPPAGQSLLHGSAVALVVSRGPKPVPVPRLVGLTLEDATKAATGLRLSASEDYSETVPEGQIVSQAKTKGTALPPGTSVEVVVSLGPPLVTVPDVFGRPINSSVARLKAAGFVVKVSGIRILGLVLRQSPGGGKKAPKGSTIHLTTT